MIEEQGLRDISQETRDVEELIPDRWFYADKLKGVRLTLTIAKAYTDESSLDMTLTFENDERWLGVTREMRLILKERFGAAPASWIGKQITITAQPNWKRRYFIKLLPPDIEEPATIAVDSPAPPVKARRSRKSSPTA